MATSSNSGERGVARDRKRRSNPRHGYLMDMDRIRELVALVAGSDIGEITIDDGGVCITVRKPSVDVRTEGEVASTGTDTGPGGAVQPEVVDTTGPSNEDAVSSDGYYQVLAPMVGTFYSAPSPESPPFVSIGQEIQGGDVLCILETMKLMNEVLSEVAGTVRGVLVSDEAVVEFGQPLFSIEPAETAPAS